MFLRSGARRVPQPIPGTAVPTVALPPTALAPIEQDRSLRRSLTFLGPAFVVAVAYVDPGNLATNTTAGAQFGFRLLWVIVVANVVAMLVQYLSAKLGIATGRSLAEQCRETFSRPVTILLWLQAEFVVVMTDLAEVVGGAVALQLLFGLPLLSGALLTVGGMSLILLAQHRGRRQFESVIVALLAVVLVAFVYQTVRAGIRPAEAAGGLVPSFAGPDSVVLAVGIVGATVMPHAVYLHSALTQGLRPPPAPERRRFAVRSTRSDVLIALTVAGGINVAILLGATALRGTPAETLEQVHENLVHVSGSPASLTFGIALLASGLAASSVGVYSGQVVMQGFLHRQIPIWVRRAVSIVPAVAVLAVGVEPTTALVASQVALSFGLPFALFPLLRFTADRNVMGDLTDRRVTRLFALAAAAFVVAMNAYLVVSQFLG
jgi:manganese transport protein